MAGGVTRSKAEWFAIIAQGLADGQITFQQAENIKGVIRLNEGRPPKKLAEDLDRVAGFQNLKKLEAGRSRGQPVAPAGKTSSDIQVEGRVLVRLEVTGVLRPEYLLVVDFNGLMVVIQHRPDGNDLINPVPVFFQKDVSQYFKSAKVSTGEFNRQLIEFNLSLSEKMKDRKLHLTEADRSRVGSGGMTCTGLAMGEVPQITVKLEAFQTLQAKGFLPPLWPNNLKAETPASNNVEDSFFVRILGEKIHSISLKNVVQNNQASAYWFGDLYVVLIKYQDKLPQTLLVRKSIMQEVDQLFRDHLAENPSGEVSQSIFDDFMFKGLKPLIDKAGQIYGVASNIISPNEEGKYVLTLSREAFSLYYKWAEITPEFYEAHASVRSTPPVVPIPAANPAPFSFLKMNLDQYLTMRPLPLTREWARVGDMLMHYRAEEGALYFYAPADRAYLEPILKEAVQPLIQPNGIIFSGQNDREFKPFAVRFLKEGRFEYLPALSKILSGGKGSTEESHGLIAENRFPLASGSPINWTQLQIHWPLSEDKTAAAAFMNYPVQHIREDLYQAGPFLIRHDVEQGAAYLAGLVLSQAFFAGRMTAEQVFSPQNLLPDPDGVLVLGRDEKGTYVPLNQLERVASYPIPTGLQTQAFLHQRKKGIHGVRLQIDEHQKGSLDFGLFWESKDFLGFRYGSPQKSVSLPVSQVLFEWHFEDTDSSLPTTYRVLDMQGVLVVVGYRSDPDTFLDIHVLPVHLVEEFKNFMAAWPADPQPAGSARSLRDYLGKSKNLSNIKDPQYVPIYSSANHPSDPHWTESFNLWFPSGKAVSILWGHEPPDAATLYLRPKVSGLLVAKDHFGVTHHKRWLHFADGLDFILDEDVKKPEAQFIWVPPDQLRKFSSQFPENFDQQKKLEPKKAEKFVQDFILLASMKGTTEVARYQTKPYIRSFIIDGIPIQLDAEFLAIAHRWQEVNIRLPDTQANREQYGVSGEPLRSHTQGSVVGHVYQGKLPTFDAQKEVMADAVLIHLAGMPILLMRPDTMPLYPMIHLIPPELEGGVQAYLATGDLSNLIGTYLGQHELFPLKINSREGQSTFMAPDKSFQLRIPTLKIGANLPTSGFQLDVFRESKSLAKLGYDPEEKAANLSKAGDHFFGNQPVRDPGAKLKWSFKQTAKKEGRGFEMEGLSIRTHASFVDYPEDHEFYLDEHYRIQFPVSQAADLQSGQSIILSKINGEEKDFRIYLLQASGKPGQFKLMLDGKLAGTLEVQGRHLSLDWGQAELTGDFPQMSKITGVTINGKGGMRELQRALDILYREHGLTSDVKPEANPLKIPELSLILGKYPSEPIPLLGWKIPLRVTLLSAEEWQLDADSSALENLSIVTSLLQIHTQPEGELVAARSSHVEEGPQFKTSTFEKKVELADGSHLRMMWRESVPVLGEGLPETEWISASVNWQGREINLPLPSNARWSWLHESNGRFSWTDLKHFKFPGVEILANDSVRVTRDYEVDLTRQGELRARFVEHRQSLIVDQIKTVRVPLPFEAGSIEVVYVQKQDFIDYHSITALMGEKRTSLKGLMKGMSKNFVFSFKQQVVLASFGPVSLPFDLFWESNQLKIRTPFEIQEATGDLKGLKWLGEKTASGYTLHGLLWMGSPARGVKMPIQLVAGQSQYLTAQGSLDLEYRVLFDGKNMRWVLLQHPNPGKHWERLGEAPIQLAPRSFEDALNWDDVGVRPSPRLPQAEKTLERAHPAHAQSIADRLKTLPSDEIFYLTEESILALANAPYAHAGEKRAIVRLIGVKSGLILEKEFEYNGSNSLMWVPHHTLRINGENWDARYLRRNGSYQEWTPIPPGNVRLQTVQVPGQLGLFCIQNVTGVPADRLPERRRQVVAGFYHYLEALDAGVLIPHQTRYHAGVLWNGHDAKTSEWQLMEENGKRSLVFTTWVNRDQSTVSFERGRTLVRIVEEGKTVFEGLFQIFRHSEKKSLYLMQMDALPGESPRAFKATFLPGADPLWGEVDPNELTAEGSLLQDLLADESIVLQSELLAIAREQNEREAQESSQGKIFESGSLVHLPEKLEQAPHSLAPFAFNEQQLGEVRHIATDQMGEAEQKLVEQWLEGGSDFQLIPESVRAYKKASARLLGALAQDVNRIPSLELLLMNSNGVYLQVLLHAFTGSAGRRTWVFHPEKNQNVTVRMLGQNTEDGASSEWISMEVKANVNRQVGTQSVILFEGHRLHGILQSFNVVSLAPDADAIDGNLFALYDSSDRPQTDEKFKLLQVTPGKRRNLAKSRLRRLQALLEEAGESYLVPRGQEADMEEVGKAVLFHWELKEFEDENQQEETLNAVRIRYALPHAWSDKWKKGDAVHVPLPAQMTLSFLKGLSIEEGTWQDQKFKVYRVWEDTALLVEEGNEANRYLLKFETGAGREGWPVLRRVRRFEQDLTQFYQPPRWSILYDVSRVRSQRETRGLAAVEDVTGEYTEKQHVEPGFRVARFTFWVEEVHARTHFDLLLDAQGKAVSVFKESWVIEGSKTELDPEIVQFEIVTSAESTDVPSGQIRLYLRHRPANAKEAIGKTHFMVVDFDPASQNGSILGPDLKIADFFYYRQSKNPKDLYFPSESNSVPYQQLYGDKYECFWQRKENGDGSLSFSLVFYHAVAAKRVKLEMTLVKDGDGHYVLDGTNPTFLTDINSGKKITTAIAPVLMPDKTREVVVYHLYQFPYTLTFSLDGIGHLDQAHTMQLGRVRGVRALGQLVMLAYQSPQTVAKARELFQKTFGFSIDAVPPVSLDRAMPGQKWLAISLGTQARLVEEWGENSRRMLMQIWFEACLLSSLTTTEVNLTKMAAFLLRLAQKDPMISFGPESGRGFADGPSPVHLTESDQEVRVLLDELGGHVSEEDEDEIDPEDLPKNFEATEKIRSGVLALLEKAQLKETPIDPIRSQKGVWNTGLGLSLLMGVQTILNLSAVNQESKEDTQNVVDQMLAAGESVFKKRDRILADQMAELLVLVSRQSDHEAERFELLESVFSETIFEDHPERIKDYKLFLQVFDHIAVRRDAATRSKIIHRVLRGLGRAVIPEDVRELLDDLREVHLGNGKIHLDYAGWRYFNRLENILDPIQKGGGSSAPSVSMGGVPGIDRAWNLEMDLHDFTPRFLKGLLVDSGNPSPSGGTPPVKSSVIEKIKSLLNVDPDSVEIVDWEPQVWSNIKFTFTREELLSQPIEARLWSDGPSVLEGIRYKLWIDVRRKKLGAIEMSTFLDYLHQNFPEITLVVAVDVDKRGAVATTWAARNDEFERVGSRFVFMDERNELAYFQKIISVFFEEEEGRKILGAVDSEDIDELKRFVLYWVEQRKMPFHEQDQKELVVAVEKVMDQVPQESHVFEALALARQAILRRVDDSSLSAAYAPIFQKFFGDEWDFQTFRDHFAPDNLPPTIREREFFLIHKTTGERIKCAIQFDSSIGDPLFSIYIHFRDKPHDIHETNRLRKYLALQFPDLREIAIKQNRNPEADEINKWRRSVIGDAQLELSYTGVRTPRGIVFSPRAVVDTHSSQGLLIESGHLMAPPPVMMGHVDLVQRGAQVLLQPAPAEVADESEPPCGDLLRRRPQLRQRIVDAQEMLVNAKPFPYRETLIAKFNEILTVITRDEMNRLIIEIQDHDISPEGVIKSVAHFYFEGKDVFQGWKGAPAIIAPLPGVVVPNTTPLFSPRTLPAAVSPTISH